jgi:hypothetical protein
MNRATFTALFLGLFAASDLQSQDVIPSGPPIPDVPVPQSISPNSLIPSGNALPNAGALPGVEGLPSAPGLPTAPGLPSGLPGVPGLPGSAGVPGLGGMPTNPASLLGGGLPANPLGGGSPISSLGGVSPLGAGPMSPLAMAFPPLMALQFLNGTPAGTPDGIGRLIPSNGLFRTYGWLDTGTIYNTSQPASGFNGPYNAVDSTTPTFNQAYLVMEMKRPENSDLSLGGRVDLLY